MSPEKQRGGPFPNALEYLEAQKIKPYPTWKSWRHQVEEAYDSVKFEDGKFPAEHLLHQFYLMRRQFQISGGINKEEVEKFWQEAQVQFPNFETDYGNCISFIIEKTPIDLSLTKLRKRS